MYELIWQKITYTIDNIPIVHEASGRLTSGKIVAMVGPSGAGKTTLLKILASRLSANGTLQLNSSSTYPLAFVEQSELLFNYLTVEETIRFAMRLRTKLNSDEREVLMSEILSQLLLESVKKSLIVYLSGGEQRRVSIAVQLVSDPPMLLLDEPTSGLDSFSALNLILLLTSIARDQEKAVLLTIHQPREDVLYMFDEIIFMTSGSIVYTGTFQDSIEYFRGHGCEFPEHSNPGDDIMDFITVDRRTRESSESTEERINQLQTLWSQNPVPMPQVTDSPLIPRVEHNIFREIIELTKRYLREVYRNVSLLLITLAQLIIFLLLLGLTFLQIQGSSTAIQSFSGVTFFIIINLVFTVISPLLNVFPLEKQIIKKEVIERTYRAASAFIAKSISVIPVLLLYYTIYGNALYWMIGYNPNAGNWIVFLVTLYVLMFLAISLGLTVSTISPNVQIAQVIGPTILIVFIIYGGNFANPNDIPGYLRWITWISSISYAYKALMQNEFSGQTYQCEGQGPDCRIAGDTILASRELDVPSVWINITILFGFSILFQILGILGLYFVTRPKEKVEPIPHARL